MSFSFYIFPHLFDIYRRMTLTPTESENDENNNNYASSSSFGTPEGLLSGNQVKKTNSSQLPVDRRRKTLQEVVTAERIYHNNLRSIKQNFFTPLQKASREANNSKNKINVSEEDIGHIFFQIEDLYSLHSQVDIC